MSPEDKSTRVAGQSRRSYKTSDDYLRWLREKNARQDQLAQEEINQTDPTISKALMVWADDGGATG
jgi:hypothetical protein